MRPLTMAGAVLVACLLTACSAGSEQHESVVATSPTCLRVEPGACTSSVALVSTEPELAATLARWGYAVSSVDWPGHPLLIVATSETSDCHAVVGEVAVDGAAVAIEIGLERRDSCTADSRPRSFVLDPGADTISSVTVNGSAADLDAP